VIPAITVGSTTAAATPTINGILLVHLGKMSDIGPLSLGFHGSEPIHSADSFRPLD
jgi:hypothetical protein